MLPVYVSLVLDDPAAPDALRAAARQLLADPATTAPIDQLIADAHRHMPTDDDHRWHMLYIDAAILKVLARMSTDADEGSTRECIATLDRAIIVAGAATDDSRRDHVVHDIIHRLQSVLPAQPPTAVLNALPDPVPPLCTSANAVRVLSALPSVVSAQKAWSRAPFVLREFARDWPAVHQWASLSYLFSAAGPGRIVPIEVGNDYRSDDWSQTLIAWDDFLASLSSPDQHLYLAQYSLFAQFPKLRDDIVIPDIVYAALDAPAYHPPQDVILNAWLGPKGTVSPAHTASGYLFSSST